MCHLRGGYHENTKLELPDDVVFAGMLPPKRLAAMLRSCALFVFPSAVPEALSLATWECALHGVVPVVYGLGALAALGRVGCPCVAPGDAAALDAALVNAVEGILRRRAAAQLAKDYVVADALRDELRAEYNVAVHDREGRWRLLEPTKRRLV
mgnify:CR=1 FL=1